MPVDPTPPPFAEAPTSESVRVHEGKGREYFAIPRAASNEPRPGRFRVFMLTHGKQVRRVSFFLDVMKALSGAGSRRIGKVNFWLAVVIT